MNINMITLFPEMLRSALSLGVVGQAAQRGVVTFQWVNPRDFTTDIHHTVDDRPYGGGDGMLMLVEPLQRALESLPSPGKRVLLTPQGKVWSDQLAREWGAEAELTLICGRYAGVDERFTQTFVDEEISIGDYVLSGGEPAAFVLVDSLVRLLPGVLGNAASSDNESFYEGLLEAPQFTRPRESLELPVPQVLLSGDHQKIIQWRADMALAITAHKRPELLKGANWRASCLRLLEMSDDELKACGLNRSWLEQQKF